MNDMEMKEIVFGILTQNYDIPYSRLRDLVDLDISFREDLGMNSVDVCDFSMDISQKFDIYIEEDDFATLDGLFTLIKKKIKENELEEAEDNDDELEDTDFEDTDEEEEHILKCGSIQYLLRLDIESKYEEIRQKFDVYNDKEIHLALHENFQRLHKKPIEDWNGKDHNIWNFICKIINVTEYDKMNPPIVDYHGVVASTHPTICILWEGESEHEYFLRINVHPEILGAKQGDQIRAAIKKYGDGRIEWVTASIGPLATKEAKNLADFEEMMEKSPTNPANVQKSIDESNEN